ncbi:unnamed protein product [Adineta ricciae]|uniref:Uncharacterized protein n=1 Tax=Adineta ricciae TaxID=249248 RepID=A0A815DQ94_ADIRI|nr:unnamed protein product [Adineta ricciae]CAF1300543.1 unnamed protein product [Adineta ricciae]
MATVSYVTLLSDWFRVHVPISLRSNSVHKHRTGYVAAYPQVKRYHRRHYLCLPICSKSKKTDSIPGCPSFARFGRYQEGDSVDGC